MPLITAFSHLLKINTVNVMGSPQLWSSVLNRMCVTVKNIISVNTDISDWWSQSPDNWRITVVKREHLCLRSYSEEQRIIRKS